MLTGVALPTTTGVAGAAAAATPSALSFDASGTWTDNGTARPVMTVVNNSVFIDMSFAHRPNATGTVLDATRIQVTFPDDHNTYLGTFQGQTFLQWSNGSTWEKVYTGPMAVGVAGTWIDAIGREAATATQDRGFFTFRMDRRPNAVGFALSATTIRVRFPDDATYVGALQAPDLLTWNNGSQWRNRGTGPPPVPPGGPPGCLRSASLLC
jgi:hypothetical protein